MAGGLPAPGGIDWHGGTTGAAKPMVADAFGRPPARPLFQTAQDPLMAAFAPPTATPRPDPFGAQFGGPATPPAPADPFGIAPAPALAQWIAPAPEHPGPATDPFGMAAPGASHGGGAGRGAAGSATDPFGMAASASPHNPSPPHSAAQADPFGVGDPFGTAPASAGPLPAGPLQTDPFAAAVPASPLPAMAADPWAMLGAAGAVDFGAMPATPPVPPPPPAALAPPPAHGLPAPPPATEPRPPEPAGDGLYARLLSAVGLEARDMGTRTPEAVVDTIGQLLRQTADGLFRLLEARTRVRHQFGVGAQVTTFQRAGNNPLKWTRSPEQALKQMIGEPSMGFLPGGQAVRGAFEDLQAHEMAMIAAMGEAMAETIRRFAPDTMRARIGARGWLKSVLPGSREATLWRAYESEFTAFADESEAAYLDLFARQFKKAYERLVSEDAG
jgi:type VI secretion system FHA domain protein